MKFILLTHCTQWSSFYLQTVPNKAYFTYRLWGLPYCILLYSKLSFLCTFKLPEDDFPEKPKYVKHEYDKTNNSWNWRSVLPYCCSHITMGCYTWRDSTLLRHVAVRLGKWLPTFQRNVLPSSSMAQVHKVATNILLSRLRWSSIPISHSDCMYLDYFLHSLCEDWDTPLDIIKV